MASDNEEALVTNPTEESTDSTDEVLDKTNPNK